ncbi:MAG TPA: dephospho-CoA kinase [Rhizomicrobium sp.]|jgi:dephospho-CoA kinase|nr:dephospho-CoA kinase [Rhizomicrobium sp.]
MNARRPLVVGLTGSIGMGKTETARMFARLGIPVHDADAAVHRLYEPGGAAVAAIAETFPDCVQIDRVNRAQLSARVRDDKAAFTRLESIVHPLVAQEQRAFIEREAALGADIVVLDVPLLVETGSHAQVDAVVVVSAPAEIQRARVLQRSGMTEEMLDQLLERQMPDVDKRAHAHFVVETDKGLRHACEQVESIVSALRGRRKQGGNA